MYIQNALFDNPRVLEIISMEPYVTVEKRLVMKLELTLVNGTEERMNIDLGGEEW